MSTRHIVRDPELVALNKQKHLLETRRDASPADWILLAGKYADQGSTMNYAYCLSESKKLEIRTDPDEQPAVLCPECDSEILPNEFCMMGHWCGTPVVPVSPGT